MDNSPSPNEIIASITNKIGDLVNQLSIDNSSPLSCKINSRCTLIYRTNEHIMTIFLTKKKLELWFFLGSRGKKLKYLGIFSASWKGWYFFNMIDEAKLDTVKYLIQETIQINQRRLS